MGESIDLINNFKVENVIFNNDEYNDLELELIKSLENNSIPYGSKTSSRQEFIDEIEPKYSIISVEKNNKYVIEY